jgi:methionyl-tRNA formyltransferase
VFQLVFQMRILFFGCDDFAAVSLRRLLDDGHAVVGLVTRPDKPKGRGLHVVFSPTKEIALSRGVEVFQPVTLKDQSVGDKLASFSADLFVVIAYGLFLPAPILKLPRLFCVNLHASLLPKYRGAAPINWAIINGERETGVTLMKMNAAMDAGDILAQVRCDIPDNMTSAALRVRLASLGAEMLSGMIPRIACGDHQLTPQDPQQVTRAPKMHKDMGHIPWTESAQRVHDLVRGVQPWPGAFTFLRGKLLKVLDTAVTDAPVRGKPGEIVDLHKDGFAVQAGDRAVLIRKVHPANSHPMDARAFLAGHKLTVGELLG